MRGFPLLNVLIVVAFFAAAWWPLQHLTGQSATAAGQSSEGKSEDISRAENLTLRATSSHPLETLTLEHLGQPLIKLEKPDAEQEIELAIGTVEIPPEGIEFWVEAALAGTPGEDQRPAIRLEVVPEDLEREPRTVTLWSQPGESNIAAPAVFQWRDRPE